MASCVDAVRQHGPRRAPGEKGAGCPRRAPEENGAECPRRAPREKGAECPRREPGEEGAEGQWRAGLLALLGTVRNVRQVAPLQRAREAPEQELRLRQALAVERQAQTHDARLVPLIFHILFPELLHKYVQNYIHNMDSHFDDLEPRSTKFWILIFDGRTFKLVGSIKLFSL